MTTVAQSIGHSPRPAAGAPRRDANSPPERLEIRGAVAKGSDVEASRTHRLTTHRGCTRNNGPSTRMRPLPIRQNDPGPISRAGVASLAAHGAGKGGNPAVPVQWARWRGLGETPACRAFSLAGAKRPRQSGRLRCVTWVWQSARPSPRPPSARQAVLPSRRTTRPSPCRPRLAPDGGGNSWGGD